MNTTHQLQVRFFELMRKRVFMDLYWVPSEKEAAQLYVRSELDSSGQLQYYPRYQHQACPIMADNRELERVQAEIKAAGVEMYL